MQALLVIDIQNGIVNFGDFEEELARMELVIKGFKSNRLPVIFMRHFDDMEESPLHKNSTGSV
ncbi:cysteine hydrolase family protein [Virgibacillus kimchii]